MNNDPTSPYSFIPPPPPKPPWWRVWFSMSPEMVNYRQRWGKTKKGKLFVGGGCLIMTFLLCGSCGLCATMSNATNHNDQVSKASPTVIAPKRVTPTPKQTLKPTPTTKPTPTPTPTLESAQPTQPPAPDCDGTLISDVCYTFTGGSLVYSPVLDFCSYFSCISNFGNGAGYVVQCNDGVFSKSGGRPGSCSGHGGNMRPIYQI
jgi:hypothetical protein